MSTYPRPPLDAAEREALEYWLPSSSGSGICYATSQPPGFVCTRRVGHSGDHVDARGDERIAARWPSPAGQPAAPPEPTAPESAERHGAQAPLRARFRSMERDGDEFTVRLTIAESPERRAFWEAATGVHALADLSLSWATSPPPVAAPAAPGTAPAASEGATAHPQPDATGAEVATIRRLLERARNGAPALHHGFYSDALAALERLAADNERMTREQLDCEHAHQQVDADLTAARAAVSRLQADHARLVEASRNLVNDERVTAWGPCDTDNPESYDCPADRWNALVEALGGGQ